MNNNQRDFIVGTMSVMFTHINFIRDSLCRNIENPSEHVMLDDMCEGIATRLEEIETMLLYPDEYNAASKYYDPYEEKDFTYNPATRSYIRTETVLPTDKSILDDFEQDVWWYDSARCNCSSCRDSYDHRVD